MLCSALSAGPGARSMPTARLNEFAATLPRDPRGIPMGGCAGGLSGGLMAAFDAHLRPGAQFILGKNALDPHKTTAGIASISEASTFRGDRRGRKENRGRSRLICLTWNSGTTQPRARPPARQADDASGGALVVAFETGRLRGDPDRRLVGEAQEDDFLAIA